MLESKIQSKIINHIKIKGGDALKITAPSRRGVPDVMALIKGRVVLIEVKQQGKDLETLQDYFFTIWNSDVRTNCIMADSIEMLEAKLKLIGIQW